MRVHSGLSLLLLLAVLAPAAPAKDARPAATLLVPHVMADLGAYRYTYVLEYEVLRVHREDPEGRYPLEPGDRIFVGHYKPWLPRDQIRDADWGDSPLGGRLRRFAAGDRDQRDVGERPGRKRNQNQQGDGVFPDCHWRVPRVMAVHAGS